jgi:hypothetical protein
LSRRLGDDPLNRARSERAKAAQAAAPAASDLAGQGTTVVEVRTNSRASYNDVFFQRREGGAPRLPVADSAPEAPEITEISQIPEIREAAAAPTSQSGVDAASVGRAEPEVAAAQVSMGEQVVSKLDAASPAEGPTAVPAAAAEAPEASAATTAPEPQKTGGFFKRLFGKFK